MASAGLQLVLVKDIVVGKLFSFVMAVFLLACASGIGYCLYTGDYSGRTDFVGLIIISVFMTVIGIYLLFLTFFEDWMLRKMYGEFSNRNHRGR